MTAHDAELSSVTTALEDLLRRVTVIAEQLSGTPDDAVALELFEAERALREAVRRLGRVRGPEHD